MASSGLISGDWLKILKCRMGIVIGVPWCTLPFNTVTVGQRVLDLIVDSLMLIHAPSSAE